MLAQDRPKSHGMTTVIQEYGAAYYTGLKALSVFFNIIIIFSLFFTAFKNMAIIRLISMNDKKYEFGDEHEYQQLQSGSNSSSERNSYVSFSLNLSVFPTEISVRILMKFRNHLLRGALTPTPSRIPL